MKLGDMLVKRGLLTPSQLESALKSQLILGGHLGTALIELGFVDEDTLGEVLSTMSGVPYAPHQSFVKIPASTIAAIPSKIAEEYLAIPLKVEEKFVHVALISPADLRLLDEISFAIGRRVIPWIAPEVRIYQALEDYYGIARRPRFITLGHQLDEAKERLRRGKTQPAPAPETVAPAVPHHVSDPANEDLHDISFGYGKSWRDIAEELDRRETAAAADPVKPPSSSPASPQSSGPAGSRALTTLQELAERYCTADSHDDLARAAIEFSTGRVERILLLAVRGERAAVWHERGFALSNETRRSAGFQITSEPLFQLLMGDDHFLGELPPGDDFHAFYRNLRSEAPRHLLLVPVRVNDLLIAMAVADGGRHGRIDAPGTDFVKAFKLFGLAASLLAMKRKLRDAARMESRVPVAAG